MCIYIYIYIFWKEVANTVFGVLRAQDLSETPTSSGLIVIVTTAAFVGMTDEDVDNWGYHDVSTQDQKEHR